MLSVLLLVVLVLLAEAGFKRLQVFMEDGGSVVVLEVVSKVVPVGLVLVSLGSERIALTSCICIRYRILVSRYLN